MKTTEENNKKLVLEAFDALFNKRDYATEGMLRRESSNESEEAVFLALGREQCRNGLVHCCKRSLPVHGEPK